MFGIGGLEMVLVGLVLLIVVRPEDLPKVFRQLGQWYGEARRIYYAVLDEINHPNNS